jgi:apolipoprotein D and lipocalin family protein
MKSLIFGLFVLSVSVSAVFSWGSCPQTTLQKDFDLKNYMGTWYEIVRTIDFPYEHGTCSQAEYRILDNGYVRVNNSEIVDNKLSYVIGKAYCEDGIGQCYVKFFDLAPWGDYEVIATDYENYSIVFGCTSIGIAHWKYGWVLSRDSSLDSTSFLPILENLGITAEKLQFTSHTGCS